jgi:hypothetical protein
MSPPELQTDANLVRVKQAWSAQLQAIERIQMEWRVELLVDNKQVPMHYVGRELRDGAKRYRAALRVNEIGGVQSSDFAGESAFDETVSSYRSSNGNTLQWAGSDELVARAGTGNYLDRIGVTATLLEIKTPLASRVAPKVASISTTVRPDGLVEVKFSLISGAKSEIAFDLQKGGWPVEAKHTKDDGSIGYTVKLSEFVKLKSHGNEIWFPLCYDYQQMAKMPDGVIQNQITRYIAKKDFVAINEHATWQAPFRLEPVAGEILWDRRFPTNHPVNQTQPATADIRRTGWSFQELDRINALASAQVRPAKSGGDSASGDSSAVSEPTRWIWLVPIGVGIVAVALFFILRLRRTAH